MRITKITAQVEETQRISLKKSHVDYMTLTSDDKYPVLYQCKICQAKLTREYSLRMHVLSHFKVKQHKCDLCNKYYSSKQYLREHKFTHTRETPFWCEEQGCGRQFRHSTKLAHHRRTTGHGGSSSKHALSQDPPSVKKTTHNRNVLNSVSSTTVMSIDSWLDQPKHPKEKIFEIQNGSSMDPIQAKISSFRLECFILSPLDTPGKGWNFDEKRDRDENTGSDAWSKLPSLK